MAADATNATDDRLLVDGEWVAANSAPIRNPYNGEVVGRAPQATAAEMERALPRPGAVLPRLVAGHAIVGPRCSAASSTGSAAPARSCPG